MKTMTQLALNTVVEEMESQLAEINLALNVVAPLAEKDQSGLAAIGRAYMSLVQGKRELEGAVRVMKQLRGDDTKQEEGN